jgi:hypothetical protein
MEAVLSSETLVNCYQLYGITSHRIVLLIVAIVRASDATYIKLGTIFGRYMTYCHYVYKGE